MGIALSLPIIYSTAIRGDTNAHLRADLHAILSALMPSVSITNGFAYTLTNPDGLSALLRVWNPMFGGSPGTVAFQMTSIDGARVGFEHLIDTGAGAGPFYHAAACPCQLLLAFPGVTRRVGTGNSLQLGIPFCPNVAPSIGCVVGIGPGATTEAWWSCGDGGSNPNSFRWTFYTGDAWSACYNGDLMVGGGVGLTPYTELNRLRLIPPALAYRIPSANTPRTLLRASNTPLYADPLLAWGTSDYLSVSLMRGQMYNCVMPTKDNALDFDMRVDGVDFVNYMHDELGDGSRWTSLLLLKGTPTPPTTGNLGNYVY